MFKSTINSVSFIDHAVSAFGMSAINATVKSERWGDMLAIPDGEHAGVYDIHSCGGVVSFISA